MPLKRKNVLIESHKTPKICVPIVSKDRDGILRSLDDILKIKDKISLVEWRIDKYTYCLDIKKVCELSKEIYERLDDDILLILTLRTESEGGDIRIEKNAYRDYLISLSNDACFDLLDAEFYNLSGKDDVELLHRKNACLILSHHNFKETPDEEVMEDHLKNMIESGADIAKLAVMPQSASDVLSLLSVTEKISNKYDTPLITMSMGEIGVLSRVLGEFFGSAVTFSYIDDEKGDSNSSAPGQLSVDEVKGALLYFNELTDHNKEKQC